MAVYIYNSTTGALVSWCPSDSYQVASASVLSSNGLTSVSGLPPLDATHFWDSGTKTVVAVSAPVQAKPLSTGRYILRYTAQEFAAITASTDLDVMQIMFALNHTTALDLSDPIEIGR